MPQPAPKKSVAITPSAVITINNQGQPSSNPVSIPSGGSVQFVNPNTNTNAFIIQQWDRDNTKHPPISVYVPVGDDVILLNDPERNCQNSVCPYNIIAVAAGTHSPSHRTETGGNNRIIVGSGNN